MILNKGLLNEIKKEISSNEIIVYGTGGIYSFISFYLKELKLEVKYFIEGEGEKKIFENKAVHREVLEEDKNLTLIICTASWRELNYDKFKSNKIYNPFINYEFDILEHLLPIKKLEEKVSDFIDENSGFSVAASKNQSYLLLLGERSGKSHPYHVILLSILLHVRGYNVTILFNDLSEYGDIDRRKGFVEFQNKILIRILNKLREAFSIPYYRLSDIEPKQIINNNLNLKMNRLIYQNYIWFTKKSVDVKDEGYDSFQQTLLQNVHRMNAFLGNNRFDNVYIWSGMHFEWGLFRVLVKDCGMNFVTSDYTLGGHSYVNNNPVAHSKHLVEYKNKVSKNEIDSLVVEEIDCKEEAGILIPLNIFWDAAAFTDEDVFDSFEVWLIKTITFILNEANEKIYVRQHPGEKNYKSGVDLKNKLISLFGENANFIFIDCHSEIDTYHLLKKVKIVLPNTTTLGLEALAIGKTVILKNDVYYVNEPGMLKATNQKEYFDLIKNNLEKRYIASDFERKNALFLYSLKDFSYFDKTVGNYYNDLSKMLDFKNIDDILKLDEVIKVMKIFDKEESTLEQNLKVNNKN